MKLVIQRVKNAKVTVNENIIGDIGKGFMVLIGVTHSDNKEIVEYLVKKLCNLRVFNDDNDKMNLSIKDIGGELLIVSQFTLYADCQKSGNRPSFTNSAKPEYANELYEYFVQKCKQEVRKVETGEFGAHMQVDLINDGPVTIIMEK